MISFPNGKINLGLNIINKRSDGFHNLETIFLPIPYTDVLEIIRAPFNSQEDLFQTTGLPIQGNKEDNLCLKAIQLLRSDFPQLPWLQVHLHKIIPMRAGLGGGSSDGAFVLNLVNKQFQLGLSVAALERYALILGSDCPFFIQNQPAYATGRGELLEAAAVHLSGYQLVLIHPAIHISTQEAFRNIIPQQPAVNVLKAIQQPVKNWRNLIFNDFETTVFQQYPELAHLKTALYNKGAIYASLTGTGSTIYGLFEAHAILPKLANAVSFQLC